MTILKHLLALTEAEKTKDVDTEEAEDKKPAKKVDVKAAGDSKPLTSWAPPKTPTAKVQPASMPPGASDKSTDDWDPKVHSEQSGAWYIESESGVGRTPYFSTKRAARDVRPGHKIVFGKWSDPDGHQTQDDFTHMKPTAMHESSRPSKLHRLMEASSDFLIIHHAGSGDVYDLLDSVMKHFGYTDQGSIEDLIGDELEDDNKDHLPNLEDITVWGKTAPSSKILLDAMEKHDYLSFGD